MPDLTADNLTVDETNANSGALNPGLSFGALSGEGIASRRTTGGNRFGLDLYTGSTPRLSITSSGNVGVGTASPATALHLPERGLQVGYSATTTDNFHLVSDLNGPRALRLYNRNYGSGTHLLTITPGGNLGIGVTNPSRRLHVDGSEVHSGGPGGGYSFGNRESAFVEAPGAGERWTWYASGGSARLWTGADKLSILPNGNVGVGTSTPVSTLQVAGDVALHSAPWGTARSLPSGGTLIWNDGVWLRLNQNRDGGKPVFGVHTPGVFAPMSLNVGGAGGWGDPGGGNAWITGSLGIGTASPAARLDVAGDIRLGSTISTAGRMHITGEEILYLLNKQGVIVSKAWGGTGNATVEGLLGTGGWSPQPRTQGWGGGIHTWDVEAEGTMWSRHGYQSGNRDLAENYAAGCDLDPGDVVCLDHAGDSIVASEQPNDLAVLGIVSTAPGVLLNSGRDGERQKMHPVALCGRIPCKVVDENGAIGMGDLLTSSSTAGHAMKARPIKVDGQEIYRPGTIIGKALGTLESGTGTIEVWVTSS